MYEVFDNNILLFGSLKFVCSNKIAGRYRDYFGNRIRLDTDHTFKCTWNFDMVASWTKGTWTLRNDTIYFSMIPTYDTLSYTTPTGSTPDSLILSTDEISERIIPEQSAVAVFYSGGQNRMAFPDKLLFRKGRLYKILDGKVVVKSKKALGQVVFSEY